MNFQLNKHGKNYVNSSKITTHFSRQMNMIRKRVLRNFQHFDLTNFLEPQKRAKNFLTSASDLTLLSVDKSAANNSFADMFDV